MAFIPLSAEDKFDAKTQSVFVAHTRGLTTCRDAWVFNYSKSGLIANIKSAIDFYNSQIGAQVVDYDSTKISWSSTLLADRQKGKKACFDDFVIPAMYRPFQRQNLYFGEKFIEGRYQMPKIFPSPESENLLICVSGNGGTADFSALISRSPVELKFVWAAQCFPLYYYERPTTQRNIFAKSGEATYERKDGVSDFILRKAREQYGSAVTKEAIFYYVYGLLHSPEYRARFGDDLKMSLPRIPLVADDNDFWVFSEAGRQLADLHLNYETVPPLEGVVVERSSDNFVIEKMRFSAKDKRDVIIYNSSIVIKNIPTRVYDYVISGKSAIDWLMERYQVKTDKYSGIVNDPNCWAEECGKPDYILQLLLSVMAVSVLTMDIVEGLPGLRYRTAEPGEVEE
jgi:predicted helicase